MSGTATIQFYAGTLVTAQGTFTSEGTNTPVDPSTITLKYRPGPNAAVTSLSFSGGGITRSSTGIYVAELDTTGLPGLWVCQWIGTGTCQVTLPFEFNVLALPLN